MDIWNTERVKHLIKLPSSKTANVQVAPMNIRMKLYMPSGMKLSTYGSSPSMCIQKCFTVCGTSDTLASITFSENILISGLK